MVTRKNIGGYRLVSLGFLDLALISTATACEGLAPALASKSKKRVVLTDIVVSGEPKNDVGVEVEKISGGYAIKNVYGYDLEIVINGSTLKATPSADHITASEIDSEAATAGQALLANGSGGVAFGDIGASNIKSGSATSGQVLTADGSGGVAFANPAGGTQLYAHEIDFGLSYGRKLVIFETSNAPYTTSSSVADSLVSLTINKARFLKILTAGGPEKGHYITFMEYVPQSSILRITVQDDATPIELASSAFVSDTVTAL